MASADGRFELIRQVGAGGYGVVYEARDQRDGSTVAFKVLRDATPVAEARFQREAVLLETLQHPSIVRYVAHGLTSEGASYLAMEWLEGDTLEKLLQTRLLAASEVAVLLRRVIEGLAFAARHGVVHRDIKPANLFLPWGRVGDTKILDFGIARRADEAQDLTRTGMIVGTPLYMSPEQARGEDGIDGRSDIFSLGAVAYECLAGSSPFATKNPLATLARICFEEPPRIESVRRGIPVELGALVHAMLQKGRADRPSYGQLDAELARFEANVAATPSLIPARSVGTAMSGLSATQSRASLRSGAQQRILCAVFVGRTQLQHSEYAAELERQLELFGGRGQRMLDGSLIVTFEPQRGALEQAVSAAQCALALHQLLPDAALALCTGRAVLDGPLPFGEIFERAASFLRETPVGEIRIDDASAGLLDARFTIRNARSNRYLQRERDGGEAPRTLLGAVTPFVGRSRELSQLELAYHNTVGERAANAVLVTAPAGAGKSRLRHEFVQRLLGSGEEFRLLIARGDSVRASTPFGAIGPAIRACCGIANSDTAASKQAKLLACVSRVVAPALAPRTAGFLGEMAGVFFPDEHAPELRSARRDPQLMADQLLESWLTWLEGECEQQPVLFILEDLHWADPASIRFVEAALRTLCSRPLLVLAFARPELRDSYPNLWPESGMLSLNLTKLAPRACEQLLDAIAGSLTPEMRAWVSERADGNPFFLEELVRGFEQRAHAEVLPDSVLGVVQARLDALGEHAKLVIRAGSVFGHAFRFEAARALLGPLSSAEVASAIRQLFEREILFHRGALGDQEYVFRHALIRDAAYALLLDEERKLGHQMAGEWLEAQAVMEPAILAHHFERGEAFSRAVHWYARAATDALEAGALQQVVSCGERAVACGAAGEVLGEISALVAEALSYSGGADDEAAEWAEIALGELAGGRPAWWRASQVLAISALRRNSPTLGEVISELLANVNPAEPSPEQAMALAFVASDSFRVARGDLGDQFLALLAHDIPDVMKGRPAACIHLARTFAQLFHGDLGRALEHSQASLEAFRGAGATRDVACLLCIRGTTLIEVGAYEEAERLFTEALQLSHRLGTIPWVRNAQQNLGVLLLARGRFVEALSYLQESADGYLALQLPTCAAVSLFGMARAQAELGDLARSAELAERSVELGAADPAAHGPALAVLASIELRRGNQRAALDAASRAMLVLEDTPFFEYVGFVHLAQIDTLLACGMREPAHAAIRDARTWLMERAARILDEQLRESFLRRIAEHARILALSEERLAKAG